MKALFAHINEILVSIIPAFLGGVVDYVNQIHNGAKSWSPLGFIVHIVAAVFFGWICGAIAAGLEYNSNIIAATGGIGGFLGVRVADLIQWKIIGKDRRR